MALDATDLLSPGGEIEVGFFPEENLASVTVRLTAYLAEGYAKADVLPAGDEQDAAAAAWAYHRAYKAIYTRMLANPSTVSVEHEGSASFLLTQMTRFGDLAQEKLDEFIGLVPDSALPASALPLASGSTVTSFAY